jgi:hypothetical protein
MFTIWLMRHFCLMIQERFINIYVWQLNWDTKEELLENIDSNSEFTQGEIKLKFSTWQYLNK